MRAAWRFVHRSFRIEARSTLANPLVTTPSPYPIAIIESELRGQEESERARRIDEAREAGYLNIFQRELGRRLAFTESAARQRAPDRSMRRRLR